MCNIFLLAGPTGQWQLLIDLRPDKLELSMLPKPEVGQLVRLEGVDERLVIKAVNQDGGRVDVYPQSNPAGVMHDVPCVDLLLIEDYSAD